MALAAPWAAASTIRARITSRASHDDYEDSYLPTGVMGGPAEDALDTACGLYLNDPTAWT